MDTRTKKDTGSFYTCNSIADYIARRAIDAPGACVLEPSFGDGIFIDSAITRFMELGNPMPEIIGIEIQKKPFHAYIQRHENISGLQMDFMDYRPTSRVHAVIGNPPYISLRNLAAHDREKVLDLVRSYGVSMQTSGSLWMPFMIHAAELLADGGMIGFVLPYEITYVRYAFALWKYLSSHFEKITICRIYNDFFPDVDVETIVFLAEGKGASTNVVDYRVYGTVSDLYRGKASTASHIPVSDIWGMKKPFERELLAKPVVAILDRLRRTRKLGRIVSECKFKIGYVCGNKNFFQLSDERVKQYGLSAHNVRKCLVNAKQINTNVGIGIETEAAANFKYLFYPVSVEENEKRYIAYGEAQGVSKGYKCRVRNPWYLTPGLEIPDFVLTVFGDVPKLLLNNGGFYVSNSLLGGFAKTVDKRELVCRWYNSLTLLSLETTIHSLGGGTLVLIPGETDQLELISDFPSGLVSSTYEKLAHFARSHATDLVYRYGDEIVLKGIYGFSEESIAEIHKALQSLRNWRNPSKRRPKRA